MCLTNSIISSSSTSLLSLRLYKRYWCHYVYYLVYLPVDIPSRMRMMANSLTISISTRVCSLTFVPKQTTNVSHTSSNSKCRVHVKKRKVRCRGTYCLWSLSLTAHVTGPSCSNVWSGLCVCVKMFGSVSSILRVDVDDVTRERDCTTVRTDAAVFWFLD